MKYFILPFFLLCIGKNALSQTWHAAGDTLKEPRNPSGYYVTIAYHNGYDTVPCTYVAAGSNEQHKGYRFVYLHNGYFTDAGETWQVFYDDKMHRIYNVERYYFR